MSIHLIGVAIDAVPDNLRVSGDGTRARISLSLTPTTKPRPGDLQITDLSQWPSLIAKATKDQVRLAVGKIGGTAGGYTISGFRVIEGSFGQDVAAKHAVAAQKLWQTIFESAGAPGFDALYRGLDVTQAVVSPFSTPTGDTRFGVANLQVLGSFAKSLYEWSTGRSLLWNAVLQTSRADKSLPNPPDDLLRANFTTQMRDVLHAGFLSLLFAHDLRNELRKDTRALSNDDVRLSALNEMRKAARSLAGPTSGAEISALEIDISVRGQLLIQQSRDFSAKLQQTLSKTRPIPDDIFAPSFFEGLRKEIARHGLLAQPSESNECPPLTPEEAALRKLAGIVSYPTLAKFLGLIIDVEVDAAELLRSFAADGTTPRLSGGVAAFVKGKPDDPDPDPETLAWSAFTCRGRGSGGVGSPFIPAYFGPCPETQLGNTVDKSDVLKDGVIDLTVGRRGMPNERRFHLETMDVEKSLFGLARHHRQITYSDRAGVLENDQPADEPDMQARGIQLRDAGIESNLVLEAQRHMAEVAGTGLVVRFAEQWLVGYSFDCAIVGRRSQKGGGFEWDDWTAVAPPKNIRWRPMLGRSLSFPSLPKQYLSDAAPYRNRDDGHVRESRSEKQTSPFGKTGTVIEAQQTLFSWVGEGLGVPPTMERPIKDGQSCDTVWPDPAQDLAIDLGFDLPDTLLRLTPPLREGFGYLFGGRAYFVNGCGLTLEEALPRFAEKDPSQRVVLGMPVADVRGVPQPDEPYVFKRHERIKPPSTLLPWNDRIVTSPKVPAGETITTLVVRTGRQSTETARRFLVPPQSTFSAGEQAGVFDAMTAPTGAYVGGVRARLSDEDGSFPIAKGTLVDLPSRSLRDGGAKANSKGSVLVLDPRAVSPTVQHYPDSWARSFLAEFRIPGENVPAGALPKAIEFWPKGKSFVDAAPVLVEIKRGPRGGPRFRFDLNDSQENVATVRPGTRYPLRKLAIVLAPGEQVRLRLWSIPDAGRLLLDHVAVASLIARLSGGFDQSELESAGLSKTALTNAKKLLVRLGSNGPDEVAAELESLLAQGPLANVQGEAFLDLVHAVDKPLEKPFFVASPSDAEQSIKFRAVVIRGTGGEDEPDQLLAAWTEYAKKQTAIDPDPMKWKSEPDGSIAFFVGRAKVDRPTSGKLRCEFDTVDYGPGTVKRIGGAFKIDTAPRSWGKSLHLEDITLTESLRDKEIDLLYADVPAHPDEGRFAAPRDMPPNPLRGLSATVGDGKAHRLKPRLFATSRFTNYLPPPSSQNGAGTYEAVGDALDEARIWIPATSRPTRPAVDRILPIFHWQDARSSDSASINFSREVSLRIFVKSDPSNAHEYWWSSGEDEMLGVVCWPANMMSANPADDHCRDELERINFERLEESAGEAKRFLTRWGADPISLSGTLDDIMPPDRLRGMDQRKDRLRLPVPNTGVPLQPLDDDERQCIVVQDPNSSFLVSVAAYMPKIDPRSGEIYFDIHIDGGASFQPFVQLGLARYQPHAIEDRELSEPINQWCHLMPRREGKVSFIDDKNLVLALRGVGFHRRDLGPEHADVRHLSDRPLLNVRLMRAVRPDAFPDKDGDADWLPVVDGQGRPVEWLRQPPRAEEAEMSWLLNLKLPRSMNDTRYGLLIEEVELVAADNIPATGWSSPDEMSFSTVVAERGPLFSHLIDLGRS